MCRQRQKTRLSQRIICKSLRRCSGLNTNGLVVQLNDLLRYDWQRSIVCVVGVGVVGRHDICICLVFLFLILIHLLLLKEKWEKISFSSSWKSCKKKSIKILIKKNKKKILTDIQPIILIPTRCTLRHLIYPSLHLNTIH